MRRTHSLDPITSWKLIIFFPIRTLVATLKKKHFFINSKSQHLSVLLPTKNLYYCERASLASFLLASMQGVKELIPAWAGISGFRQSLQLDRWHFSLHFCWVDSQEFLDLWEFVYEFMIQLYRGWILNPNVGIVLHDSVYCFDDCLGPVQHSLSAAKRLFRRTFDKAEFPFHIYKSGITWIIEKRLASLLITAFWPFVTWHMTYMTWSTRLFLLPASWPYRGLTLALGLFGTPAVHEICFRTEARQQMDVFVFFWENQTGQEPEAHCFEERVFHTSRSPNMCCPFIRPFWRTIFYSLALWAPRLRLDVPWLRNSRRMGCFGISFWPETNQQKNAARPSEFFWELHGPNVPWDLTEILLPAGWFLATSIP